MATVVKIGPEDHGRVMAYDEYLTGDYEEGYKYELIDGALYVSPEANFPLGLVERWIYKKLDRYSEEHPEVTNLVHCKSRVFVGDRPGVTVPEPDVVAFKTQSLDVDWRELRWEDAIPILVVEVVSEDDPDKDFVRNVALYLEVPSIKEYWILDGRDNPNRPTLYVYRRRGSKWQRVIEVPFGATYATKLLPGFTLVVDPHR